MENSSLIIKKNSTEQALGIVISMELAFAMCEEFGWNPEIISSNTMAEGSFEEKQNRDAMSTDPHGAELPKCEICKENPASFLVTSDSAGEKNKRWICQHCNNSL